MSIRSRDTISTFQYLTASFSSEIKTLTVRKNKSHSRTGKRLKCCWLSVKVRYKHDFQTNGSIHNFLRNPENKSLAYVSCYLPTDKC